MTKPFERMHAANARRLTGAAFCVVLATGAARLLYSGALPQHWVVELVTVCLAGSIAAMLTLELLQRRQQLKQVAIVEDSPPPYGIAGTVPPPEAAANLGAPASRSRKTPTRH